jgi:hypothetical protein
MKGRCVQCACLGALALALFSPTIFAQVPPPRSFSFAVIGDAPYFSHEEIYLQSLLASFAQESIEFVVHVGDIKSGSSRCDTTLYEARRRLFSSTPRPFVLVPGDNDWADCHRPACGGYDPEERLDAVRQIFYRDGFSLGTQAMQLERQSRNPAFAAYREHARWMADRVVFVSLNVAGSGNRYGSGDAAKREASERMRAVSAWLREGFAKARENDAPGIVIVFHADPRFDLPAGHPRRKGYEAFLQELATASGQFGRPVLLVHGDSHQYRTDQPWRMRSPSVPNVTRLSAFGSPSLHWVRVTVVPESPGLFEIEPQYGVPGNSADQ